MDTDSQYSLIFHFMIFLHAFDWVNVSIPSSMYIHSLNLWYWYVKSPMRRRKGWIAEDPSGIGALQSDTLSSLLPRLKTVPMAAETKLAFSSLPGPFWFHFSPPLSHTDLSAGSSLCCQGREEWEEAFSWAKRLSFAAPTLLVLLFPSNDSLHWFTANMLQCGATPQLYFLPLFMPLFPSIVELFDLLLFFFQHFSELWKHSLSASIILHAHLNRMGIYKHWKHPIATITPKFRCSWSKMNLLHVSPPVQLVFSILGRYPSLHITPLGYFFVFIFCISPFICESENPDHNPYIPRIIHL